MEILMNTRVFYFMQISLKITTLGPPTKSNAAKFLSELLMQNPVSPYRPSEYQDGDVDFID
jgi:hypothetical protein